MNLPYKYLKSLCGSNKLCVKNERSLLTLFEQYLKHRDNLPLLPEEDPSKDWSNLNEEERKNREEKKKLAEEEEKKAHDEEEAKKKAEYDALDPQAKNNADWAAKIELKRSEA